MANTPGSQQGQGPGSGNRSNQDPAQKSGTGQHSQQGNPGNQGKGPKDMDEERNRGNQPGGGSQHSGQQSGGSGGTGGNR